MNLSLRQALALAILLILPAADAAAQPAYQFTSVVHDGDPGPNGPFYLIELPAISEGVAAFRAVSNVSNPLSGIYTGSGGPLTTIATSAGGLAISNDPVISQGTTAFIASSVTTQQTIFTGNGGLLSIVAKQGDAAPVGNFSAFDSLDVNGPTVAFRGFYSPNGVGAFSKTGGMLTTIAKNGDAAPTGAFYSIGKVSTDGADVAFLGYWNPNQTGLFTSDVSPPATIAKTGDPAPAGVFDGMFDPQFNAGSLAFSSAQIVLSTGGVHEQVVKVGDPAPLGAFYHYGNFSLGVDKVAFVGYYNPSQSGIFVGAGAGYHAVVKSGDSLFGSTVTAVAMGPRGYDRDGSGRVAFSYGLADGRSGLAIATIIPEPAALTLSAITALALATATRRTQRTQRSPQR